MDFFRYCILLSILCSSTSIGFLIAKKYVDRLKELNNVLDLVDMIQNRIKFTRLPIKEILIEISQIKKTSISNLFFKIGSNMKNKTLKDAWNNSIEEEKNFLNLNKEDLAIINNLGNILGKTDVEGQLSGINLFKTQIKSQIQNAYEEKRKNEKMYRSLGSIVGLVIVILLI